MTRNEIIDELNNIQAEIKHEKVALLQHPEWDCGYLAELKASQDELNGALYWMEAYED